jgi:rRNA maturation protein Rpf1
MIITTARKPSPKTRTFCRNLGRFAGWEYITRGKSSLSVFEDGPHLIVGDYRGNPGSFNFFKNGISILSIHASVSIDMESFTGEAPFIVGDSPLAHALSKATGCKMEGRSERIIRVKDNIEFIDEDIPYITLKVVGIRGEGIA